MASFYPCVRIQLTSLRRPVSPAAADGRKELQVAETIRTAPVSTKGVKFQDGLSPGQGDDGETVIPGVDKHNPNMRSQGPVLESPRNESKHRNLIERTTWTFIMIAGFIGPCSLRVNYPRELIITTATQCYFVWDTHT
jgi:hypothetical protein